MLSETIKLRLAERFAAPLPEFHKRRIVFWHNEDGEFGEAVDELALGGVTLVKLTGRNNFAVKKLFPANGERFTVKFTVKFTANQETILSLMRETPTVTVSAIAAKLNISERAVKKNIAKLKDLGILARIGAILDLYVHPQMEQKKLCVELLARNCKQKWTF